MAAAAVAPYLGAAPADVDDDDVPPAAMDDDDDDLPPIETCADLPCLLYTSPSPRDRTRSRMPSSA